MQLTGIYDATELSTQDLYQIDGAFYKYRYTTDSVNSKNYVFRPLPNQNKKADKKLSRNKLATTVKRVDDDNSVN